MNGLYDSIVKIVISHHVQFSYLGRTFISSRDQAFFPPFFAVMGPSMLRAEQLFLSCLLVLLLDMS